MTRAIAPSRLNPELHRLLLYAGFGLLGLATDFLLFTWLRDFGLQIGFSNSLSYLAGTLLSFTLNFRFNFRSETELWRRLGSFVVIAALGATGSSLVISALAPLVQFSELLLKALITVPFLAGQYVANRIVTFGRIGR